MMIKTQQLHKQNVASISAQVSESCFSQASCSFFWADISIAEYCPPPNIFTYVSFGPMVFRSKWRQADFVRLMASGFDLGQEFINRTDLSSVKTMQASGRKLR
eukprot:1380878-Amphidinium_carterae.2